MTSIYKTEDTDENNQLIGAAMAVCQIIISKVKSGEISKDHPNAGHIVESLMWLAETGELPDFEVRVSEAWERTFTDAGAA